MLLELLLPIQLLITADTTTIRLLLTMKKYFISQMEKSPTLGSIDTSDTEKRFLSEQSAEFNLRNKIFNELFPNIVEV